MSYLTINKVNMVGLAACVPPTIEENLTLPIFADKSEAAAAHENLMLDDKNFGEIINEEIERIKKKRGDTDRSSPTV